MSTLEHNPTERFAAVVEAFQGNSEITPPERGTGNRRAFGSNGLKVNNKIFAMLVKDRLVVKIPAARVKELAATGEGTPFDPGHGRLMKEWLVLEKDSNLDWLALANEASEFVTSI